MTALYSLGELTQSSRRRVMGGTWSLRTRAWSLAALVFLLVMLLGLFSLWRLDDYDIIVGEIRERYLQNTQFLGDLNNFTSDFRAAEGAALLASAPSEIDDNAKEIERLDHLVTLAEHSFEHIRNDAATNERYADFAARWLAYRHVANQVLALANTSRGAEGIALYRKESRQAYDAASDALGLLTERNRHHAAEASQRADKAYRQARYLTVLAIVVAGLIVIGGLIYVRRTILRPLFELAKRMRRLVANEMDIESAGIERRDEVGEMARAVMVFRNNAVELAVSQRALAQQASMLSEKLTYERHLTELQRNFLAMASHEFRTPLTIIDGQAQRLINARERLTADDIARRASDVRAAVARMTIVIDRLIDASRLTDGGAELYFHPGEFDLAALLHDVCQSHRELTPHAQIIEHLVTRPLAMVGDQKLLSQVFHNIVGNAVKYSPRQATVHVSTALDGGQAVVTVEDRGLGVPAADLGRLFERYYRGSNVTGIVGSGIGLYLVKTVIDLHQGAVSVESREGEGSRFVVRLPVNQPVHAGQTLLAAK
jgi:two-component system, OmpR family, sensor kinase